jgi:hypothetical protein
MDVNATHLKKILDLKEDTPNDMELGKAVRSYISENEKAIKYYTGQTLPDRFESAVFGPD